MSEKTVLEPSRAELGPATTGQAEPNLAVDDLISIDHFAQVRLRVAQILTAERIEKSEKLLKLQVDVGESRPRQILAGIAKHYAPDDLPGRKIVIVANLKPAKLMGQLSEGMLLAASDDKGNLELVSPGAVAAPGATVR